MDNVGGAEEMIEHLYDQGHRRIAILTGPQGNYDSERRLAGCRRAMSRLGLSLDEKLIWNGAFTFASGIRAARQLLRSRAPMPDAIFCLNDAMAIAMLAELRDAGVSVPGDVALAGFDNVDESAHMSLTTVAAPMRLMGETAARAAVDLVVKGKRPRSQLLPVRLVVRASSRARRRITDAARRRQT
jgi:LacI family transcriptional regulator